MAQANVENVFLAQSSPGNVQVSSGTVPIRKTNPSNKNVPDIPFLQGMPDAYVVSPADWETGQGYIKKNIEIVPIGPVPESWMLAGIFFVILGAFVAKRWLILRWRRASWMCHKRAKVLFSNPGLSWTEIDLSSGASWLRKAN